MSRCACYGHRDCPHGPEDSKGVCRHDWEQSFMHGMLECNKCGACKDPGEKCSQNHAALGFGEKCWLCGHKAPTVREMWNENKKLQEQHTKEMELWKQQNQKLCRLDHSVLISESVNKGFLTAKCPDCGVSLIARSAPSVQTEHTVDGKIVLVPEKLDYTEEYENTWNDDGFMKWLSQSDAMKALEEVKRLQTKPKKVEVVNGIRIVDVGEA